MVEFVQIKLEEMISELGEDEVKHILSSFSSPKNEDVQDFIRNKAILFSKKALSKTVLVYWVSNDGTNTEKELVGYYALANKILKVEHDTVSKITAKRLFRYGTYNQEKKVHEIPAILIGQLSKNFTGGNECLISGSDLLQMALRKVKEIQGDIGGKFVFLECEEEQFLIEFYEKNGFVQCGRRKKDRDEIGLGKDYLLQMIMYLS